MTTKRKKPKNKKIFKEALRKIQNGEVDDLELFLSKLPKPVRIALNDYMEDDATKGPEAIRYLIKHNTKETLPTLYDQIIDELKNNHKVETSAIIFLLQQMGRLYPSPMSRPIL